jgi:hypothetical protein
MKRIEVNLYEGDKLIGKKEFAYDSLPYLQWDTNIQKVIKDIEKQSIFKKRSLCDLFRFSRKEIEKVNKE